MIQNGLTYIGAPDANAVLERNGLLRDSSQRPGKPLRDLLRAGKLRHAYQQGRTWIIPISGNAAAPAKMNIQRNTGPAACRPTLTENNHNGAIMKFKSIEDLRRAGFGGFVPVSKLKSDGIFVSGDSLADAELDSPGVYLVVRTDDAEPVFVPEGSGGHFKGRNPNVPAGERKMQTTSCSAGARQRNLKMQKILNRNLLQISSRSMAGPDRLQIFLIDRLLSENSIIWSEFVR